MEQNPSSGDRIPRRMVRPLVFLPEARKGMLRGRDLQIAAKGDIEGLQRLLMLHPERLNRRGSHNRTLLWEAVRRGKLPAAAWLVEQGAEVNATGRYNGESFVQLTPYCAAIYYRRWEVAEDPQDNLYYVPPLSFAVAGGRIDLVEFLLGRGALVAPYSLQLLSLAAKGGLKDMLDLLLDHQAQVVALGELYFYNTYPLEILRYLLEHGAGFRIRDQQGETPLALARRYDRVESAHLLEDRGAVEKTGIPQTTKTRGLDHA